MQRYIHKLIRIAATEECRYSQGSTPYVMK